MRWIKRGSEPKKLKEVRKKYTGRWVTYYKDKRRKGKKPSDSRWREFEKPLGTVFRGMCGYCEEICKVQVDHFRPKVKFPVLVYEWTNWIYSCNSCNGMKWNKWPSFGYVNPCADEEKDRPEEYFYFDVITGEILPRNNLIPERRSRAQTMIDDLGLND